MTEAPFADVGDAVAWSFQTLSRLIVKTSSLKDWRGAEVSSELTPWEAHAQAAMILSHLDELPEIELQFMLAKYLPPRRSAPPRNPKQVKEVKDPESGELRRARWRRWLRGDNPDRAEALKALAEHTRTRVGMGGRLPVFLILVDQYFAAKRQGVRPLRQALKLSWHEALRVRRLAFEVLERVEVAAESRLHYSLMVAGMVPGRVEWTR